MGTIAARLFYHKETGQPLKYAKTEGDKKLMESCQAKFHTILRRRITTLAEITQNPGNFAREFCHQDNAEYIRQPLPDIPDTETWNSCMQLWRNLRKIHKSNQDPSDEEIDQYTNWVIEFQEKLFSLKWVPVANQVHRLSHIAYFMRTKSIRSIGAYSLEGNVSIKIIFPFIPDLNSDLGTFLFFLS